VGGANLGMQTSDHWTALSYAAVCGREDNVALLLDEEANLEVRVTNG
jgi:ankyrin repeat protein